MKPKEGTLYLPRLDQLRFVAAAMVVCSHAWTIFYKELPVDGLFQLRDRGGEAGVALFFVLSGFIFTYLAEANRAAGIDYRKFIYNRAVRIFPLLIFVLMIAFAAQRKSMTPIDMLYPLMLMTNSGPALKLGYPMLWSITWTISVEFQFYLIFPFLYRFSKTKPMYLVGLIALMLTLRAATYFADAEYAAQMSYLTLPYRIDQFALGMLLGFMYNRNTLNRVLRPLLWLATIGAAATIAWLYSYENLIRQSFGAHVWLTSAEGVMWMVIIAGALSTDALTKNAPGRLLTRLGSASYSLYLTHLFIAVPIANQIKPVLEWTFPDRDPRVNLAYALIIFVIFPLACLLSWVIFKMIEQPFFQFRTSYYISPKPHLTLAQASVDEKRPKREYGK